VHGIAPFLLYKKRPEKRPDTLCRELNMLA